MIMKKKQSKNKQSNLKEYLGRVINSDCLEEMKKLPDNCIDAVITDPP